MGKYFGNTVTKFTCQLYCFTILLLKDDLYIGTDIGVYHKDNNDRMASYLIMDYVSVRELEIQYTRWKNKKLLLEEGSGKAAKYISLFYKFYKSSFNKGLS